MGGREREVCCPFFFVRSREFPEDLWSLVCWSSDLVLAAWNLRWAHRKKFSRRASMGGEDSFLADEEEGVVVGVLRPGFGAYLSQK